MMLIFFFRRDILYELAFVGDLPLPQPNPVRNKRGRDDDDTDSISIPLLHQNIVLPGGEGKASSSNSSSPFPSTTPNEQMPQQTYTLPMYTNELGQMPLHDRFNFSSPGNESVAHASELPTVYDGTFDFDAGNLASTLAALFGDSNMTEPKGNGVFQSHQNQGPEHPLFPFEPDSNLLRDDDSMWSRAPSTFECVTLLVCDS
jgi:hypothetical protein